MKLINFDDKRKKTLDEFMKTIVSSEDLARPGIFIGFDKEGDPSIYAAQMTWEEIVYLQYCLSQFIDCAWKGLEE